MLEKYSVKRAGCALIAGILLSSELLFASASPKTVESSFVSLILGNLDIHFPVDQQCTDNGDTSAGKFLADSLILIAEYDAANANVTTACNEHSNTDELRDFYSSSMYPETALLHLQQLQEGARVHQCTLMLGMDNTGESWSRGIQILADESGQNMIEGTMRCLLTP